jgi:D-xylose transport system substrate-binding protein
MSIKRAVAGAGALVVVAGSLITTAPVMAQGTSPGFEHCNVGVSWNNFEQPRWAATDKPSIQQTVEAGGGTYLPDFNAKNDNDQQLSDVQSLIDNGADVLIILAADNKLIGPALESAKNNNIPVIGYDRLIEDPYALYLSFDNVLVGKAEADAMLAHVPSGNYVLMKGHEGDPNASVFLPEGWRQAGLYDKIDAGEINVVYETFTDNWKPEVATNNMDAAIQKANNDNVTIDAVLAENDSTAFGSIASLVTNGLSGVPVSGQDGDHPNLQYVAQGLQYVDVWKDSNWLGKVAGAAALQLCAGVPVNEITVPADIMQGMTDAGKQPLLGDKAVDFNTPGLDQKLDSGDENVVSSILLQPTPITAPDLQKVLDGNWLSKEELCAGVTAEMPGAAVCGVSG